MKYIFPTKYPRINTIEELVDYFTQPRPLPGGFLAVNLGENITIGDVLAILNPEPCSDGGLKELWLFFHGDSYAVPDVRQAVLEDALVFSSDPKVRFLLQIFLLTEPWGDLSQGCTGYLSDSRLAAAVARNIQEHAVSKAFSLVLPQPLQVSQEGYIIRTTPPGPNYRYSKRLDAQALQAQVSFMVTSEQQVAQTINQTQTVDQTQEQQQVQQQIGTTTNSQVLDTNFFIQTCSLNKFTMLLVDYAYYQFEHKSRHPTFRLLHKHGYFTAYHHSHGFLQQLQHVCVAEKIAQTMFGTLTKCPAEFLLNGGFVTIDATLVDTICRNITSLADGFDQKTIAPYWHLINLSPFYQPHTLTHYHHDLLDPQLPGSLTHVAILGGFNSPYQSSLCVDALYRAEDLNALLDPASAIADAKALLDVFLNPDPDLHSSLPGLHALIAAYFRLLDCYGYDCSVLRRFFSGLEVLNLDYLKIVLQLPLSGYKPAVERFLKILDSLEQCGALDLFFRIYFAYAETITAVWDLIHAPTEPLFLKLTNQLPVGGQAWPSFEKFALHFMVFAARHLLDIRAIDWTYLTEFWHRMRANILRYNAGDEVLTDSHLASLVDHLVTADGLALGPVHLAKTVFQGLEHILDCAIAHDVLAEQLRELPGLSLLWTDAPYALKHQHFKRVSADMQLQLNAMFIKRSWYWDKNPYEISALRLRNEALSFFINSNYSLFKAYILRYLGVETLCEDLSFYRNFLGIRSNDIVTQFFRIILLAYVVLTRTGEHFTRQLDKEKFSAGFQDFLKEKKTYHPFADDPDFLSEAHQTSISTCVDDFAAYALQVHAGNDTGRLSLWDYVRESGLSYEELPQVFKKPLRNIAHFLVLHRADLEECSTIFVQYPHIVRQLLTDLIGKRLQSHQLDCWLMLAAVYPQWSIQSLIAAIPKIEALLMQFALLKEQANYPMLYGLGKGLAPQLGTDYTIDVVLSFVTMVVSYSMKPNYTKEAMQGFLLTCIPRKALWDAGASRVLELLVDDHFTSNKPERLALGVQLVERLLTLDDALYLLQTLLYHSLDESLLRISLKLSDAQLRAVVNLLATGNMTVSLLTALWAEDERCDFDALVVLCANMTRSYSKALLSVMALLYKKIPLSLPDILQYVQNLTEDEVYQLGNFIELGVMDREKLLVLVQSADITTALTDFEKNLYNQHPRGFATNSLQFKAKVAHIRQIAKDEALAPAEQDAICQDYEDMMAFLCQKPIVSVRNQYGESQFLTIQALNRAQFATVYAGLRDALQAKTLQTEHRHTYRLQLLALAIEALYRTTLRFPRDTQILCVLHSLYQKQPIIQEVKTGEGKSIISQLQVALCCAEKRTVHLITENTELAASSLRKFRSYYRLLNIPYAEEVITAQSQYSAYVPEGVNPSTPSQLSFFLIQMTALKKALPQSIALICDEIDAVITSPIQFRLATTLDPLYVNPVVWNKLYPLLLDFVNHSYFVDNTCDWDADIHNFKCYARERDQDVSFFLQQLPEALCDTLLHSAQVAWALKPGVDFLPVRKNHHLYAAPIMAAGTKRPEPQVSYANGVQALLHSLLNRIQGNRSFAIDPETQTVIAVSPKNLLDYHRCRNAPIIGYTGTAGSAVELTEFADLHGIVAYHYPAFYEDKSENLGLHIVAGVHEQHAALLGQIRQRPLEQPVLIITDSPKAARAVFTYLQQHMVDRKCQSYEGYAERDFSEAKIIHAAGLENMVTVTTPSLSRGTDFFTEYPTGFLAINCATDITPSEWRQITGRIARNGWPGQFCAILNSDDLSAPHLDQDHTERFAVHQAGVALTRQNNRLKTRVLEEIRYFILTAHCFKLRAEADALLGEQYGMLASLFTEQQFLLGLHHFHKVTEQYYLDLLKDQLALEPADLQSFIGFCVAEYNTLLVQWLPESRLSNFVAIAPLIAVEKIQNLPPIAVTIGDLTVLSDGLSTVWRYAGHHVMQECWQGVDHVLASFSPYFAEECSLFHASVQVLEKFAVLDINEIATALRALETSINGLDPNIIFTQTALPQEIGASILPTTIIDQFKNFACTYLSDLREKIIARQFDAISLPDLNVPWIQTWLSGIQNALQVFSTLSYVGQIAAGPIPFVMNRIIFPLIMPWIKNGVKILFAASELTMLQVLAGIDDLWSQALELIDFFSKTEHLSEQTVATLLQKFQPLFDNKAVILLFQEFTARRAIPDTWVIVLPQILALLEPHRALQLKDIAQPSFIMQILLKIVQMEEVKILLAQMDYVPILRKIQSLDPNFAEQFHSLTLPQLVALIKVLAHPSFNDCLQHLPRQDFFATLQVWLKTPIADLPSLVQEPLSRLQSYQDNPERIAQARQQAFTTLSAQFQLRDDNIYAYLESLVPRVPTQHVISSTVDNQWWLKIVLATGMLLLLNYFFFQWSVLLVMGVFALLLCAPLLWHYFCPAQKPDAPLLTITVIDPAATAPSPNPSTNTCQYSPWAFFKDCENHMQLSKTASLLFM